MRKIFKKMWVLGVFCMMCFFLAACSHHRKSQTYGTEVLDSSGESDLPDDNANADENAYDFPVFSFTDEELEQQMQAAGYVKSYNEETQLNQYTSQKGCCLVEMSDIEHEQMGSFPLTIEADSYTGVIDDEDIKKEYLDIVKIIVELEGDSYEESRALEFMKTGDALDGDYYSLSDHVRAYAQIYQQRVLIYIGPDDDAAGESQ